MSLTRIADQINERARQLLAANPSMDPREAQLRATREIQQENQERAGAGQPAPTPEFTFGTRAGAWAPPMDVPTWGVTLHNVGDGEYAAGFWFGQDRNGRHLWVLLAPGGAAQLLRDGVPVEQQGSWQAEARGDGLEFYLEVPRGWTHPVDYSPSPNSTVFEALLSRVL